MEDYQKATQIHSRMYDGLGVECVIEIWNAGPGDVDVVQCDDWAALAANLNVAYDAEDPRWTIEQALSKRLTALEEEYETK